MSPSISLMPHIIRVLPSAFHCKLIKRCYGRYSGHFYPRSRDILRLSERGIFQNIFPEESAPILHKSLVAKPQCCYCGFDPTSDSLHVGHLVAIMALLHCQRGGHQVIALIGGATAQLGDPSGHTRDRPALKLDAIMHNVACLRKTLDRIFINHQQYFIEAHSKEIQPARILDNSEWYRNHNVIEFVSNATRHFRLGTMLGRHSVQSRLKSPEGMNFPEFSYQIFQAYDWLHLYTQYNCSIQIGGNDQMGNIMSGYDLIQKIHNKPVFGLTVPLITSTTGDKLGKTAGNAVWLNPSKTTSFELYQYFLNVADTELNKYLKMFTFYQDGQIEEILLKHEKQPEKRAAQKFLAEHVLLLAHGEHGLASARRCTEALFHSSTEKLAELTEEELNDLFNNAKTCDLYYDPGMTVMELVMKAGCFNRQVDAERVIKAGGVHINQQKITQAECVLLPQQHILSNKITVIRIGKKNYYLVRWLGAGL